MKVCEVSSSHICLGGSHQLDQYVQTFEWIDDPPNWKFIWKINLSYPRTNNVNPNNDNLNNILNSNNRCC